MNSKFVNMENHENPQFGHLVFGLRIKPATSKTRSRNTNVSTMAMKCMLLRHIYNK